MIWIVVFTVGLLVGFVVARWWALLAALALGAYIALESEVELPPGLLALIYAMVAGAGIAAGLLIRRSLPRQ